MKVGPILLHLYTQRLWLGFCCQQCGSILFAGPFSPRHEVDNDLRVYLIHQYCRSVLAFQAVHAHLRLLSEVWSSFQFLPVSHGFHTCSSYRVNLSQRKRGLPLEKASKPSIWDFFSLAFLYHKQLLRQCLWFVFGSFHICPTKMTKSWSSASSALFKYGCGPGLAPWTTLPVCLS